MKTFAVLFTTLLAYSFASTVHNYMSTTLTPPASGRFPATGSFAANGISAFDVVAWAGGGAGFGAAGGPCGGGGGGDLLSANYSASGWDHIEFSFGMGGYCCL